MKTYLLDTNVLIHDPKSMLEFEENKVIICAEVIQELDNLKGDLFNAREVFRILEETDLEEHNIVIETPSQSGYEGEYMDIKIINKAIVEECILVTKDRMMKVLARENGLKVEDYQNDAVEKIYKGHRTVNVSPQFIDALYQDEIVETTDDHIENEYINFKAGNSSALARYQDGELTLVENQNVHGISGNNREQIYALDALMDESVDLVTITGEAGSGKTLLSLACGLEQVVEQGDYNKLNVGRPTAIMGDNEIGFLPGSKDEKLDLFMQPIFDSLETLYEDSNPRDIMYEFKERNLLNLESIGHIRGRSMDNQFVMIDECFPYDTLVVTEDGGRKIGSLFVKYIRGNQELPKVLSFNEKTEEFEYKNIITMKHQGERELVRIKSKGKKIDCTPEHPFLTTNGWKKAINLKENDYLIMNSNSSNKSVSWLNEDQQQVVLGSYLGDGSLSEVSEGHFRLGFIHCEAQKNYLKQKADIFNRNKEDINYVEENGYSGKPAYEFNTFAFGFPFQFEETKKNKINKEVLREIDERGLSIWYMDDGNYAKKSGYATLNTHAFTENSIELMLEMFKNKFNILGKKRVVNRNNTTYYKIVFNRKNSLKLFDLISKYIHKDLKYKLPKKYRNQKQYEWDSDFKNFRVSKVSEIKELNRKEEVFDMEVRDNHNFLVTRHSITPEDRNGFVVHNCQNLTPHEMTTILTRIGKGTKIVLTGDLFQIDKPYLDKKSNGLAYVIDKFKEEENVAQINLEQSERSRLASQAINLL